MKTIAIAFLLPVCLALTPACSSDDPVEAAEADVVHVTISSNQFDPPSVTIKAGQTVRWTWSGGTHNVVSGAECGTPDQKFKSGAPIGGGTYEHLFETAGSFPYYCEPHCGQGMKGTIVVE
jgi:plastocyanin